MDLTSHPVEVLPPWECLPHDVLCHVFELLSVPELLLYVVKFVQLESIQGYYSVNKFRGLLEQVTNILTIVQVPHRPADTGTKFY
jgi:hypothetical protein